MKTEMWKTEYKKDAYTFTGRNKMHSDLHLLKITKTTRVRPGYKPQKYIALVLDRTSDEATLNGHFAPCWHILFQLPIERKRER